MTPEFMKKLSFLARTSLIIGLFFGVDKVLAFVRTGIISRQYRDSLELPRFIHVSLPSVRHINAAFIQDPGVYLRRVS